MSITFLCKLLDGDQILDANSSCTFSWIRKDPQVPDGFEGEGTLTILSLLPLKYNDRNPRQFYLSFESAIVIGVGKIEKVPIYLAPADLIGHTDAPFRIGTV
jgi:hypothetical protein